MSVRTLKSAMALFLLGSLLACTPAPDGSTVTLPPLRTSSADANGFATQVLDSLQARSIAERREYCGLILRAPDGGLYTSPILSGGEDFCEMPSVIGDVVATFHTHGSYSPDFDNEVPSLTDVAGDFSQRIDGYVATPAGRVWHIDFETRQIVLLCGPECVAFDPDNDPSDAGFVPPSFTLPELRARFAETG